MDREIMIDIYGKAVSNRKQWEQTEKEAKKELVENGVIKPGQYLGNIYSLNVAEVPAVELDIAKVRKQLTVKEFDEVASVSIEKLKKYLPESKIDKCISKINTSLKFTIKKK